MSYERLEQRVAGWAVEQTAVKALLVTGSRARNDHPADRWSDLDLLLVVDDPARYAADARWLNSFGEVWLRVLNHTGAGDPEWMILYEGGLKVDFILAPHRPGERGFSVDLFYAKALRRGLRVLVDKPEGGFVPPVARDTWVRPTAGEFSSLYHHLWLDIYRATQMLQRGELWRARMISDGPVRRQMLLLLEWYARASHDGEYDTWYAGRFLSDWLPPELMERVADLFAPFQQEATKQALAACLSLADRLGREIARRWGYPYPIAKQAEVLEWIMLNSRGE